MIFNTSIQYAIDFLLIYQKLRCDNEILIIINNNKIKIFNSFFEYYLV